MTTEKIQHETKISAILFPSMKEQAYTSIADMSVQDRIDHDIWLRDFVCPLTYTEAELDELARLDAMKHKGCHEI